MMFYHGVRNVEAFPSGPAGAQAEIGVFAIKKETGVESADLVQQSAAVKGRGSTREKRLFQHRKILRRPAVAALFAAGIPGNQHAGKIKAGFPKQPNLP